MSTASTAAWRAANRGAYNAYQRAWRAARPGYDKRRGRTAQRTSDLMKHYEITDLEYAALLYVQGGVCAVCKRPETATFRGKVKRLAVDHDHETGLVRGLLCSLCNLGLGHFGDDPELLYEALRYVA